MADFSVDDASLSIMKTFGTVKYLERKYCKIYAKSLKKGKKGLQ